MKKLFAALLSFAIVLGVLVFSKKNNVLLPDQLIQPSIKTKSFEEASLSIGRSDISRNLFYLCDDRLEGRMSGMRGNDETADYVVSLFKSYGLSPGISGWKQNFTVNRVNEYKEKSSGKTANVIAMLPGTTLKNEVIVIGAHMDHIGYGPNMSEAPSRREVHNGADDNASGTVCMLSQAKAWGQYRKNRRTLVFIAFSGEEMGLVGSKYYINNPTHSNIVAMINHDMVGRYRNKGSVSCLGAGNSPEMKSAIDRIKGKHPFRPVITSGSGGGSDHVPFYQKGIPICFFHTGGHDDYHTPDDKAEKIDVDGVAMIAKFGFHLVYELDKAENRPTFIGKPSKETTFKDH